MNTFYKQIPTKEELEQCHAAEVIALPVGEILALLKERDRYINRSDILQLRLDRIEAIVSGHAKT